MGKNRSGESSSDTGLLKIMEVNKIYNEDCLETMARMPDNFIDLTVTSPPYDDLRVYKGYSFDFEKIALELYRVTKAGGVVVWVVNDSTVNGSETLTSCKQKIYFREVCGFNIHDTMIFRKDSYSFPESNRYYQVFEYMIVLSKGKPTSPNLLYVKTIQQNKNNSTSTHRNVDGKLNKTRYRTGHEFRLKDNIWEYGVGNGKSTLDQIAFEHPATFPEQLVQDHIASWSDEGNLIYDPFMGSGTTAKMCIKTNRNYIGSEISKEYCELAEKRIKPYKDQLKLAIKEYCEIAEKNIKKELDQLKLAI